MFMIIIGLIIILIIVMMIIEIIRDIDMGSEVK